eukprot:NODE_939_length_1363_cov_76.090563_g783_i0.p1 GENE.NODE_939_length_1363_cov_76.090563_g783_i0~~NODE_939_length_1363_cov_76.090563_g783_i0.p1  ORF type:complete len:66 (-),score=18.64 NODE_939_length_1363_cov_76.090563_g783_i0:454-651(-)
MFEIFLTNQGSPETNTQNQAHSEHGSPKEASLQATGSSFAQKRGSAQRNSKHVNVKKINKEIGHT